MISIVTPNGIAPRFNARVLPDGFAQIAENCDLEGGDCRPVHGPVLLQPLADDTQSIFLNYERWIEFPYLASVVASADDPVMHEVVWEDAVWPDVDEMVPPLLVNTWADTDIFEWLEVLWPTERRYYWTLPYAVGGGGYKGDGFRSGMHLGVSRPGVAPTVTVGGTGTGTVERDSSYVYTYVTTWGEESAPSRPTEVISFEGDEYASFAIAPPGDAFVSSIRIYRSAGGMMSDVWVLVPYQITAGAVQFDNNNNVIYDIPVSSVEAALDGMSDADLNVTMEVLEHHPPAYNLHSLTDFANGIMGGIAGTMVCFTEPWLPYAWPARYRYSLDERPEGLGHIAGMPVALTSRSVYIFEGTNPGSYVQRRVSVSHGLVSPLSIASTCQGVLFASNDGLCRASYDGVTNLTRHIWTRRQWLAMHPETLIGYVFRDVYYGFFRGTSRGIAIPMREDYKAATTINMAGFRILNGYLAPDRERLYLLLEHEGSRGIYQFDSGDALPMVWKSKIYHTPASSYSAIKVAGDPGRSQVDIYVNEMHKTRLMLEHNESERLPGGWKAQDLSVRISGRVPWYFCGIAESMGELNSV